MWLYNMDGVIVIILLSLSPQMRNECHDAMGMVAGGQVQHRALEAWLALHSKAVPYQQVFKVPQPGNHNKTLPFRAEVDQTSAVSDSINEAKTPPLSVLSKDWNVSHPGVISSDFCA